MSLPISNQAPAASFFISQPIKISETSQNFEGREVVNTTKKSIPTTAKVIGLIAVVGLLAIPFKMLLDGIYKSDIQLNVSKLNTQMDNTLSELRQNAALGNETATLELWKIDPGLIDLKQIFINQKQQLENTVRLADTNLKIVYKAYDREKEELENYADSKLNRIVDEIATPFIKMVFSRGDPIGMAFLNKIHEIHPLIYKNELETRYNATLGRVLPTLKSLAKEGDERCMQYLENANEVFPIEGMDQIRIDYHDMRTDIKYHHWNHACGLGINHTFNGLKFSKSELDKSMKSSSITNIFDRPSRWDLTKENADVLERQHNYAVRKHEIGGLSARQYS